MSGTRCVMLDTVHQCKILTEYLNHLYVTNPTIGLVSPSRLLAMNLLWTLVSENMDGRNKIIHLGTNYNLTRGAMLFGTLPAMLTHEQARFAETVFDIEFIQTIYDDLNVQLNQHQVMASYTQWTIINTGNNIVLGEDGDVRVLQWEEQHSSDASELVVQVDLGLPIEKIQKALNQAFGYYPPAQADAMVLEELQTIFPELKRMDTHQIGLDYELGASYGMNISSWSNTYVRSVLDDCGIPSFRQYIQRGIAQTYSFNPKTKIITFGKELYQNVIVEDSDQDLARQLLRGDFLRREDRERAERYIQENPCM